MAGEEATMTTVRQWHGGAVLVLAVAGLLIAAGVDLADTDDVDIPRGSELVDIVDAQTARVAELEERTASLAQVVDDLGRQTTDVPVQALLDEVEQRAVIAGFTAVEGPGVTVSLDDAPVPDDLADLPTGTTADDYVVHQQDVEAVVNAFWTGGAEALQIMDRRITSVSAVRCVGNVIILDGQVYSPPFTITAVGDPDRPTAALDESEQVQIYRQWADYIGLGFGVEQHESVLLPPAGGPSTLTYAEVVAEETA
jgi:uncharacterized protein YlxW (UPF0749 family)